MKTYNTPEEVAADLPEGIAQKYLKNYDPRFMPYFFHNAKSMGSAISGSFNWQTSPEGAKFWDEIAQRARAGEFDPKGEENSGFIVGFNNLEDVLGSPTKESGDNLLPCPFCGTQPVWVGLAKPNGQHFIKCPECNFVMAQDRKDKVIGHWNQRRYQIPVSATLPSLDQIKDEVAKEHGYPDWADMEKSGNVADQMGATIMYHGRLSANERQRADKLESENKELRKFVDAVYSELDKPGKGNGSIHELIRELGNKFGLPPFGKFSKENADTQEGEINGY